MSRKAGQVQRRQRPKTVEPKRAKRPTLPEVDPLFSTYDAPKPDGARFDKAAADRAVRWIERNLRHYQGRHAGRPFYLLAWQRRLIRELFGWMRADGTRLFRRCYVEAPRKSGKTSLAAAIALYLAYGDGEAGPQIGFAAYDQEQAKLCYGAGRHMVEANPELFEQTTIYNSALEMKLRDNPGGIMRCLSRESAQQFGLNLHGLVFDELFTQKNRDMWGRAHVGAGRPRAAFDVLHFDGRLGSAVALFRAAVSCRRKGRGRGRMSRFAKRPGSDAPSPSRSAGRPVIPPPPVKLPRPGPSAYEGRFDQDSDRRAEHWVTIAESGPDGELRWVDGWERRAQGWTPLNDFLEGDGRW